MEELAAEPSLDKCMYYAKFMSRLDHSVFDPLYWCLFLFVIGMLFAASWKFASTMEKTEELEPDSPERLRELKRCTYECFVYFILATVAVVFETYALMALQFCDGEDLISLYWSTWTVLQVGSVIAIAGILLASNHHYCGRKHPPWALALGTPVLVVAGIGHFLQHIFHKSVKSSKLGSAFSSRSTSRAPTIMSRSASVAPVLPMSQADTLRTMPSDLSADTRR